jgi:hypothetical protein
MARLLELYADERRGARLEVLNAATGWRIAATAIFVSLAWLPVMLPLWNRLPDLAAVYLRLFFVR